MADRSDIPRGLVLWMPDAPAAYRRRRILFITVLVVAALSLIWPVYPLFSGIRPLIFGFPLSFAYVIGWLAIVFVALGWLYRSE